MSTHSWTRKEELATLYLRAQNPSRADRRCSQLARAVGRSGDAIWMRMKNFDALDPAVHCIGLNRTSRQTQMVWAEYERDPQRTLGRGREAYESLLGISG